MTHPVSLPAALALGAAALAFAAPAAADDAQGWEITPNGKTCTMLSVYEGNMSVGLILAAPEGDVSFIAAGDGLEKVAGKAGATVPLHIRFDGHVQHTDWTHQSAQVVAIGTHRVAVVADWGVPLAKEFAATVAGSNKVTIDVGGKDSGSYDLSGSREASAELMRCGTQVAAN